MDKDTFHTLSTLISFYSESLSSSSNSVIGARHTGQEFLPCFIHVSIQSEWKMCLSWHFSYATLSVGSNSRVQMMHSFSNLWIKGL